MENRQVMTKTIVLSAVAILIFAALLIGFILLAQAQTPGQGATTTTAPALPTTTEQTPTDTTSTEASASVTTASETTGGATVGTTYPAATVPVITTAPKVPVIDPSSNFPVLSVAQKDRLLSLDNTLRGWGPGTQCDDRNRPFGALSAQNAYGKYGSVYIKDDDKIYLTFDEGYENGYTAEILDVLKAKNVKAVFFITMPYAKSEPALVQRMIDEGHIVGNHSTAHLSFPGMTLEDAYNDIRALHDYVLANFDYEMKLFRFPMGESSDRTQALLQELGYTPVFWSFAYRDWETDNQPAHDEAFAKITGCAHPGAVYLLHAVSETNTKLLPSVIDYFRGQGYELALFPTK
ncbi:MAG: polysaccharide deacetylase family protein [Clostridia bacterium]|nr:polysaccharide deacetylase family protein [Clostridia bacterium]